MLKEITTLAGAPQRRLQTAVNTTYVYQRSMFQAILSVLMTMNEQVSHYQEELKVLRNVANKQALDHAEMMRTFHAQTRETTNTIDILKSKYRRKMSEQKREIAELQDVLSRERQVHESVLGLLRKNKKEVTVVFSNNGNDHRHRHSKQLPHSTSSSVWNKF